MNRQLRRSVLFPKFCTRSKMASLNSLIVLLAVVGLSDIVFATAIQPRMINGAVVDTLERFGHHVSIEPIYDWWYNNNRPELCGGSIIKQNWILTSAHCVLDSLRLRLHIQRLHKNDTAGSYSIVMNNNPDNVIVYPTRYDDIALLRLPVDLKFSRTVKPIDLCHTPVELLVNKLAVLPGFNASVVGTPSPSGSGWQSDRLTYAMLKVVPNSQCKSYYKPGDFDEYLQICASSWGNSKNAPCLTDFGSGMVTGWPAQPQLLGIYSNSSYDCSISSPSAFTYIQKYISWIDSVTSDSDIPN